VFLSYSRDDTERVTPLRDALRHMGYRIFFDTQSIDPGEQWKTRLERSIQSSRTLVLCWSENTRGSDYITFEYSRAEALHKPVLPWLLDKTPLPAMLEFKASLPRMPGRPLKPCGRRSARRLGSAGRRKWRSQRLRQSCSPWGFGFCSGRLRHRGIFRAK
jgi:hypothetical protein